MLSKIEITGTIEIRTGMHIGASEAFAAIGAIDSPVARDPVTNLPYIPGSSFKGKMRSLLARAYNEKPTKRENDDYRIARLFGTSKDKTNKDYPAASRLIFSDAIMSNNEELDALGIREGTEAKFENAIDPITSIANPRQIERVVRGSRFPVSIIYNVVNTDEIEEDFKTLAEGIRLLQYDYIGGHGSRGYGKIGIDIADVKCVVGEVSDPVISKCAEMLKEG